MASPSKPKKKKKKAEPKASTPRLVSVIDIGSTAIRLVIAEITGSSSWNTLDRAVQPISLGRDVFLRGNLSPESIRDGVAILERFKEMLAGWAIPPADVRVIATAAIREARNRDIFIDRVMVRTGFRVNVVAGIEESHLTYLAVQHALTELKPQFARSRAMILEVGGGTSELMLLNRGRMIASHNLGIGTLRVEKQVLKTAGTSVDNSHIEQFLREHIRVTRDILNADVELERIRFFVAVGGDARIMAERVGKRAGERFAVIPRETFTEFLGVLRTNSTEEVVRTLRLTWTEAEGLFPALAILNLFMEATAAEELIVPDVSIREGVLLDFTVDPGLRLRREFTRQVSGAALALGRKYRFDEPHATTVTSLALQLFDQLVPEHGLDSHGRLLLEVAAMTHDIGYFIRPDGHHKHGQYILENSEIFGLSRTDLTIIGLLVRFHRGPSPSPTRGSLGPLRWSHRMMVLKLAAILRVADALDRGHLQRITTITVQREGHQMVIQSNAKTEISTERQGLEAKGGMFEEIFGYEVTVL